MRMSHFLSLVRSGRTAHLLLSTGIFALLAALLHFAVETERARIAQALRTRVTQEALGIVLRLEAEVHANAFLATGMFAFVTTVHTATDEEFEAALKSLYQIGHHVRNVALAPGNRLRYIYPLQGNESALGLYFPDVPAQWGSAERAIQSRSTVLAGPVKLVQGGVALISRTPVFQEDSSYWGLLSLALNMDSLFQAAGLAPDVRDLRFAMRGKDGLGDKGDVFFGDASLFDADSIRLPVSVPGGQWILAAMPRNGWRLGQDHLPAVETAGLIVVLLVAWLIYLYQQGRERIAGGEQRLRAVMDTARDAVVVIDADGVIHDFNLAARTLFGYGARELSGMALARIMQPADSRDAPSAPCPVAALRAAGELRGRRKDGSEFPAEISVGDALMDKTHLQVAVVRDITERKVFEQRLVEIANTDSLTGVMSRRAFLENAQDMFLLARRHGKSLSFMMLDADRFKQINDTYGHPVGDEVLRRLTRIIYGCLRETDKLGRMGGEEFAILLPETDKHHAIAVAERVLSAVREAQVAADSGAVVRFTASIGLASLAEQDGDIDALMRLADTALYTAKREGRDRWSAA